MSSPLPVCEWRRLDEAARARLLARPAAARAAEVATRVRRIVRAVERSGDAALRRWTAKLDGVRLERFEISEEERRAASGTLARSERTALERAAAAIRTVHEAELQAPLVVAPAPNVRVEIVRRPLSRVGLYVPAGGAPLPSTALMLAVPAAVAGCGERIVVTPPRSDGRADPGIVVAATLGGATRIFKVGGAQAVAALAFGSESVPRVDKIFGPGSVWVDEAKRQVAALPGGPAIDLPAGPSELFVVADASADPRTVAADLLAQAEHSADAQVFLATPDRALAAGVGRALARALRTLPRGAIAARALAAGRLVLTASLSEALAVAARYAPEHLALAVEDPGRWRDRIGPAGAVYLGTAAAPAFGDYATGANHTLPTGGASRSRGGLALADFQRQTTFQTIGRDGTTALASTVATLARLERLEGHARSVEIRSARAAPARRRRASA